MIAFVKGILDTVDADRVVVENQGVGFEILVPGSVAEGLPETGNEVKLYTYTHVREDALQLYGFLTGDERKMFELLITVNGIGPKGALAILGVMDADTLRFSILAGDDKSIAKAPGIGAKTAAKLILELRDKCSLEMPEGENQSGRGKQPSDDAADAGNDAVQALVALGYSSGEAAAAVRRVDITPDMGVEDILKQSLKNL